MMGWEKHELIKAGGQADIFRATDELGSPAAMKILRLSQDPTEAAEQRRRFDREVKCHLSLDHSGIMPIYGADLSGPEPSFVMPLGGQSLRGALDASRGGGLGVDAAIAVARVLFEAMAHAHSEGVIHRDLKPDNVVFVEDLPKITDFGYGRIVGGSTSSLLTRGGLGTEGYAAPEQFNAGHDADERSDVFALGCVVYEMFTGRKYAAGARWPDVPPLFRYVLMTATNIEPDRRFQSIADMSAAFELAAHGGGTSSPSDKALELAELASRSGGSPAVIELAQLLVENSTDAQLYLRVLPYFDRSLVRAISRAKPDLFKEILIAFDAFAVGGHPFSFTDRLATFLCSCFVETDDFEIRTRILERLLILGSDHNRYFVGDRFLDLAVSVAHDDAYAQAIAGIIRANIESVPFVREKLQRVITSRVILQAVA